MIRSVADSSQTLTHYIENAIHERMYQSYSHPSISIMIIQRAVSGSYAIDGDHLLLNSHKVLFL